MNQQASLGIMVDSLSLLWYSSLKVRPRFLGRLWRAAIKKEAKGASKLHTIKPGIIKKQMVLGCLFTLLVLTAGPLNTPTLVYSQSLTLA